MAQRRRSSIADPRALASSIVRAGTGSADSAKASRRSPGGRPVARDIDMRIARDGTWFYHGTPIARKQLVRLFASILQRDEAGRFCLVTPVEVCRIVVEDAPFLAVELTVDGSGPTQSLSLRTNVDDHIVVNAAHALRIDRDPVTGGPAPYVRVRDGLDARLTRSVYYEIVDLGEERDVEGVSRLGVWSEGVLFDLGALEETAYG
jgi:hypothetical protein